MARKKWEAKTEITPSLLKFREKRKWQINLRRYVLDQSPCPPYAPFFALDIILIRKWFESQFQEGMRWDNFGKKWQFGHIIPVTYFDQSVEEDLRLCWNFINLKAESLESSKIRGSHLDVLGAKMYFKELFEATEYEIARKLWEKIERLERAELLATEPQQRFLRENRDYLHFIKNYSVFEFELLNNGRSPNDVAKEISLLEKKVHS
jgi:hypothetical protein